MTQAILLQTERQGRRGTTQRRWAVGRKEAVRLKPARIKVDDGSRLGGGNARTESFEACDQYQLQGEAFAAAMEGKAPVPVSLEDAFANMAVIGALFRSGTTGRWEEPERLER